MKEKTKKITNWDELIYFISNLNHYKKTIYISGWIKELQEDHTVIKELLFTTADVSLLVDDSKKVSKVKKGRVKKRKK